MIVNNTANAPVSRSRQRLFLVLGYSALTIFLAGLAFAVYAGIAGITYLLLGLPVPGAILGLIVSFLGVQFGRAIRVMHDHLGRLQSFDLRQTLKDQQTNLPLQPHHS